MSAQRSDYSAEGLFLLGEAELCLLYQGHHICSPHPNRGCPCCTRVGFTSASSDSSCSPFGRRRDARLHLHSLQPQIPEFCSTGGVWEVGLAGRAAESLEQQAAHAELQLPACKLQLPACKGGPAAVILGWRWTWRVEGSGLTLVYLGFVGETTKPHQTENVQNHTERSRVVYGEVLQRCMLWFRASFLYGFGCLRYGRCNMGGAGGTYWITSLFPGMNGSLQTTWFAGSGWDQGKLRLQQHFVLCYAVIAGWHKMFWEKAIL